MNREIAYANWEGGIEIENEKEYDKLIDIDNRNKINMIFIKNTIDCLILTLFIETLLKENTQ